jgi:hypothetical protein
MSAGFKFTGALNGEVGLPACRLIFWGVGFCAKDKKISKGAVTSIRKIPVS